MRLNYADSVFYIFMTELDYFNIFLPKNYENILFYVKIKENFLKLIQFELGGYLYAIFCA